MSEYDYITRNGILTDSKGAEKLSDYFEFKSLPNGNQSDLVVLHGEELEKAVQRAKVFKERAIVQEIRTCYLKYPKQIFAVRGMRRTGKTTALLQFCEDVDDTIFISIRRGSKGDIFQLIEVLRKLKVYRVGCLLIDEITELEESLTGLHFLYDAISCEKIIVTGSDSLVLNNPFFDGNNLMRVYSSNNLNYITLKEWCDLTGEKDYTTYIQSLGTLMRFQDDRLIRWFNLSLFDNIVNSLKKNKIVAKKYPLEYPLSAVISVLLQASFGTEIYRKDFKTKVCDTFLQLFDLWELDAFLSMRNTNRKKFDTEIYLAIKMLEDLDYIVEIPQYTSILDLREDQRDGKIHYLCTLPYVSLMIKSILAEVHDITVDNVLNSQAVGTEFENFVVAQIVSISKQNGYYYKCCKFRTINGEVEFDLVLEDVAKNLYVFEIKASSNPNVQLRNLENKEKYSKVCRSDAKKICVYRGESYIRTSANGFIEMVNVTDFFCEYFPKILERDPYCPETGSLLHF